MPPDPRPAEQQILDAAYACFSRFGVRKTVMDDVAREAGISRGSVYRYFADKESLFRAVSERLTREVLADMGRRTARLKTLSAKIERIAGLAMSFLRDEPMNAAMAATDPEAFTSALTTDGRGILAMSIDLIEPMIRQAAARGEVRPDIHARRAAEWTVRMVFSLLTTPSVTFDRDDPAQMRRFIREFLVPGMT